MRSLKLRFDKRAHHHHQQWKPCTIGKLGLGVVVTVALLVTATVEAAREKEALVTAKVVAKVVAARVVGATALEMEVAVQVAARVVG